MNELTSAAELMKWLGERMPKVLADVRGFAGPTYFHACMRAFTGVTREHFDSHDHACAAYLEACEQRWPNFPLTTKPGDTFRIRAPKQFTVGGVLPETLREYKIRESASTEKKRDPLPGWGQRTEFDPLRAFFTDSETGEVSHVTFTGRDRDLAPTPVHSLQRLAEGDPRCGSAWLLGR